MANFELYSKSEYFEDLRQRIAATKRGDRVAVATMTFDPNDSHVAHILDALTAAASRGVTTSLAVDAFNFLSDDQMLFGPLFFVRTLPKRMPKVFRDKLLAIKDLRSRGVNVVVTNWPQRRFSNPVGGRSHIKFAIINNRFYIGGCNLGESMHIDIMAACEDQKTADWLYDFSQKMLHSFGTTFMHGQDVRLKIDDQTELLVDAGTRKQSIIYDEALKLIDRSRAHVFITCQFFPNTVTAKQLLRAFQRGANVEILYNHASKHVMPKNWVHHLVVARERARMPASFFARQLPKTLNYIHAKVLANEGEAIVGSHNFVTHGVNFGTAEIALHVRSSDFAKHVQQKILSEISS